MPHGIVSNCRLSGEIVRDGSVTTEHSRTCTVGPCRTCWVKNDVTFACIESVILTGKNPLMRKCPCSDLYWHDNADVSHPHTGSLGVKCDGKSLCFTTRQVFHSFKFHSKTCSNTLKGYFAFGN